MFHICLLKSEGSYLISNEPWMAKPFKRKLTTFCIHSSLILQKQVLTHFNLFKYLIVSVVTKTFLCTEQLLFAPATWYMLAFMEIAVVKMAMSVIHLNGIQLSRMVWERCFPNTWECALALLPCQKVPPLVTFPPKFKRRKLLERDYNYINQFVFGQQLCFWFWTTTLFLLTTLFTLVVQYLTPQKILKEEYPEH